MTDFNYLNGTWTSSTLECFNMLPFSISLTPSVPVVKRIIFNNPATIVFWKDGTKTVVKCMEGQPYSEYYGFLCALGKKLYGSNSALNRLVDSFKEEKKNA